MKLLTMQDLILFSIPIEQLKADLTETIHAEIKRQFRELTPEKQAIDLLTRKEAAKLLGVSQPTVLNWTKTGKITGYRISSRIRYKRSELENSLTMIKTKS